VYDHEITAHKQTEEALAASEQLWRTLAETLSALVGVRRPAVRAELNLTYQEKAAHYGVAVSH